MDDSPMLANTNIAFYFVFPLISAGGFLRMSGTLTAGLGGGSA